MLKFLFFLGLGLMFFPIKYYLYINVAISGFLLLLIAKGIICKEIPFKRIVNNYNLLILIWLLWSLTSILWVKDYWYWTMYNGILFIAMSYAVAFSYLSYEKGITQKMIDLFFVITIIHNLVGWIDYFTGKHFFTLNQEVLEFGRFAKKPMSFFNNPNDFALLLLFSVLLFYFVTPNILNGTKVSRYKKIIKTTVVLSSITLIFFTGARLVLLTLIYSFIFVAYILRKSKFLKNLILIVLVSVCIGILFFSFNQEIFENILSKDESSFIRWNLIKNGFIHLQESNYFGVGAGNSSYYMAIKQVYDTGHITYMHNWWFEILVNYGLIFFIIYLLNYLYSFLVALSLDDFFNTVDTKFISSWLIAFIVGSVPPSSIFTNIWVWPFMVFPIIILENKKLERINTLDTSIDKTIWWWKMDIRRFFID